jgi:4-aminobutyrate aminotransferase / (S)-3-amino-2-methylpropionate transaminase / 5-aminovalerate transaminase
MMAGKRQLVTEVPGPRSRALHERRVLAVSDAVRSNPPVYIAEAHGAILVDVDGNSLLDLGSGIAVASVGHAEPAVVDAVQAQVARFSHTCFMVTPYEGYVALCEALNELTPGSHAKKSALFNSGAEAVENAVKLARYTTARDAVVVFDHAYHGRTNLTMAMTAKSMPYKRGFGPFAPEVYRAPMSYPMRDPRGMTGEEAARRAMTQVEIEVGASSTACVVVEPIQGEGGFIVPAPGFLPALRDWCTEHGALLVADEIQTGFCRTGDWFACEDEEVVPDLVVTAKGIAGGLPLSGVTGRSELMDAVHGGGLGGTYGGNPVSCASALGAIEVMRRLDLAGRARQLGDVVLRRLRELAATHGAVGDVRGRGAMCALELVHAGTLDPDPAAAAAVAGRCHAEGVVILTCGTYGNVVRLLPPLVIDDDQLEDGLEVLAAAIAGLPAGARSTRT